MRGSWILTWPIAFYVLSLATDSFEELIMIRGPLVGTSRELTCVAEDDGSALVLNLQISESQLKDTPTTWSSDNTIDINWSTEDYRSYWKLVSTLRSPMGPVFDYRWEGLPGYSVGSGDRMSNQGYYQVGSKGSQSGSIVFSARGLGDIHVILCELLEPSDSCARITITARPDKTTVNSYSPRNASPGKITTSKDCQKRQKSTKLNRPLISEYEWGTFIFDWKKNFMRIQTYNNGCVFVVNETRVDFKNKPSIFITASSPGLVRPHIYDYLQTTHRGTTLHNTLPFYHDAPELCIELLVSLCPECELIVKVVDTWDSSEWTIGKISGDTKSAFGELPTWRLESLNVTLSNFYATHLKLEISTQMKSGAELGRWAIDGHFRKCRPVDAIRKSSSLIVGSLNSGQWVYPIAGAGCQKLSYTENSVVKGDIEIPHKISTDLLESLRNKMNPQSLNDTKWYKGKSICDQTGCTCAPGFNGSDCHVVLETPSALNVTTTTAVLTYPKTEVDDTLVSPQTPQTNVTKWMTNTEQPTYSTIISEDVATTQNPTVASPTLNSTTESLVPDQATSLPVISKANGVPAGLGFPPGEKLSVKQYGNHLVLTLPPIINSTLDILITVVVKGRPNCATSPISDKMKKLVNMTNSEEGWVAETYNLSTIPEKSEFEIVEYPSSGSTRNCYLLPEVWYVVIVVVDDQVNNASAVIDSLRMCANRLKHGKSNFIWLVILVILLTSSLLLFVWRQKLFDAARRVQLPNVLSYLQNSMDLVKSSTTRTSQQPVLTSAEVEMSGIDNTPQTLVSNHYSHSVNIEDFEDYVRASIANGMLSLQFSMIRKDMAKPRQYGLLPKNRLKNRYINILPYDDTRVVLTKTRNDSHSDYINANYVQGFRKEKAYIATQGPKPETIVDFWRMIWQEKARIICMLANAIEGQKPKCEQYWPEIGDSKTYGDIVVVTENHHVFIDYILRTFRVSYRDKSRKIEHLHYTGWPDHNVPMHSNSVVAYLKKLQAISIDTGPIIVHCSAGVGRTGTIILCDICSRGANANGNVDVLAAFGKLRECRVNMVDNERQYLFAHLVLAEYLLSPSTTLPCNEALPLGIEELKTKLPEHIERLRDIAWQDRVLHPKLPPQLPLPKQLAKNRFPELAPDWSDLVYLQRYPTHDSNSDYISTVIIDGLKTKKQFVASQLPLPTTLSDFWRLIAEQKIELVIVLQQPDPDDPTCCDIISDVESFNPVPFITVKRETSTDLQKSTKMEELLLTEMSGVTERTQRVTVLTCQGWGLGKNGKPPPPKELIELWRCSKNVHQEEGLSTLVLCHDGIAACGLYLALNFLLERMAVERECDVILAVRTIRRSRPEFVQSQEQFEYLYDAAVEYTESFEANSNFT